MSSPEGRSLGAVDVGLGNRGDAAGETDFSEKVVVGESEPLCGLEEDQPKKEVSLPAAGDLGLLGCGESGVMSYGSSSMKSSVTPSSRSLRLGCRGVDVYKGMLGIVGDRVCDALFGGAFSSCEWYRRNGSRLLVERSCRGAIGKEGDE